MGGIGADPAPADSHWRERRERAQKDQRGLPLKRPKPDLESHVNLTDPDSRVARDYWGRNQAYNVEAAATRKQIVIAAEPRQATAVHQMWPMVEAADPNPRTSPSRRSACYSPRPATTPAQTSGRWRSPND